MTDARRKRGARVRWVRNDRAAAVDRVNMKDELDNVNPHELTQRILKKIQEEIRATREEVRVTRSELGARIDGTNARIDEMGAQLGARIDAVEHTLVDLAAQQHATVKYLRERVAPALSDLNR